ncbi:MAG: NUDIX domain-containing protein [Patescibacteria group bacterium]
MNVNKTKLYYPPAVTVDAVIFTIQENDLGVLLIERSNEPFKNCRALPGGFLVKNEPSADAVARILKDKAGIKGVYTEQLYTFDNLNRDPRGHILTVAYFALSRSSALKFKKNEKEHPQFFLVKKLPTLAFDHKKIINYALSRLRAKLEYTNIIYSLLPDEFTMSQLQKTYEIILGKKLDKRNFIKKFLSLGIIKPISKKLSGPRRRPAQLYRFISKKSVELKKFF